MHDEGPDTFQSIGQAAIGVVGKLEAQRHRITAPGLYQMPADVYHADPMPDPSLSRSIVREIITRSPRHAWSSHPRLNPAPTADDVTRKMDVGSIAHAILFAADNQVITVIEADDYRTKDAKAARDQARAMGKLPALIGDYEKAIDMAASARDFMAATVELRCLLDEPNTKSEVVVAWRESDVWCRAMIDRCSADLRTIVDFKSTTNAHPAAAARRIWDNDYQLQPPWYTRGLDAVDPAGRGRRQFYFLFQETEPPYACSLHQLAGDAWAMGERQCNAALAIWRDCMASGTWPAYGAAVSRADMPAWKESGWLAREEQEPALAPRELTVLDAG